MSDSNLRKLEKAFLADPSPENRKKYRIALMRNGFDCGFWPGDLVLIQEHPDKYTNVYLDFSWVAKILRLERAESTVPSYDFILPGDIDTLGPTFFRVRLADPMKQNNLVYVKTIMQMDYLYVATPRDEITVIDPV